MCAIAGVIGAAVCEDTLRKMLHTMTRRGPDGDGIYLKEDCALLHSRLAVIDPEGGAQPMALRWKEERYVLVYNGELYNTHQLRRELEELGHRFQGHSDTEVVVHAYAQWGAQAVERFNGIFALAVWEEANRRLFLARDRIGVKPLFYARSQGGLIFASEIKTILQHPEIRPELDAQGAAQILLLGPGRAPGSGVLRGIQEIEPGCRAYFEKGRMQIQRYWFLEDREHTDELDVTLEKVRYLVTDSIKRQMVSDVPIGCFLSGGLDSSIISAICAQEKKGDIDTFSVDYVGNDQYFVAGKFQPDSDGAYIRLMEQHIGSRHHWTLLDTEDLLGALERATIARDLPGMADVDFSLFAFCGQVRKKVKVALSGECADEIFGGYPWFRDPQVRDAEGFPWAQNTALRVSLLSPEIQLALNPEEYVHQLYLDTLAMADILPGTAPLEKRMKQMTVLNFRWFMQTLLDRKDRMSMYHGLEVRVPFCDYRIAQYLYGVPWEMKNLLGREKGLLRKAMEGILPQQVLYRRKSPYPKTFDPVYEQLVRQRLESLLVNLDAPLFQIVDRQVVRRLMDVSPTWPWYGQLMTRPQFFAYLLQINFWLEHYKISLV